MYPLTICERFSVSCTMDERQQNAYSHQITSELGISDHYQLHSYVRWQ